jgi:hypothetical protein
MSATAVRWTRYKGERIRSAGHRMFIEHGPTIRFGPVSRTYGYVWPDGDCFHAYYETDGKGEIVDVDLGPFRTEREARRTVEIALGAKLRSARPVTGG